MIKCNSLCSGWDPDDYVQCGILDGTLEQSKDIEQKRMDQVWSLANSNVSLLVLYCNKWITVI